jgi:hypothetical protein
MPSKKANRYGTICEKRMAEKYSLELARASWKDADRGGRPVEIKSTRRRHSDGQPGNFKIYEEYHRKLRRHDGEYCFVVYRVRGDGARILESRIMHSSKLPRLNWHGGGSHRDSRQTKLPIGAVFG